MKRFNLYAPLVLVLWLLLPANHAVAQQTLIRGILQDALGLPVEGATITLTEDPSVQTVSNTEGVFTIRGKMGQHLEVAQDKQARKKFTIRQDTMNLTLDINRWEIPIGYGQTRSPDELTGAVDVVRAGELSKSSVINPENALYGRIPGLTVLQNGGRPPTGTSKYIRGRETFTNPAILILVDGFERPLSSLSADEIESVTVLKDAAALAMYGQRGANGVMLITTKRGGSESLSVNVSYDQGITQPVGLPDFLEAPHYARARNEALINDGAPSRYSVADIEAFASGESPYLFPNVNWFDEVLRDYGTRSNFNISFEGGGENIRYFAVTNYLSDTGIFGPVNRNEDFSTQWKYSRFNFRSNLDIDITPNLLFQANVGGNVKLLNIADAGDASIFNALYSIPSAAFPVTTPNDNWGGTQIYGNNPVALLTSTGFSSPIIRELFIDGRLRQDLDQFMEGLSAEVAVGYGNQASYTESKRRGYSYEALSLQKDDAGNILDTTVTQYGEDTELNFRSGFGQWWLRNDILGKLNYAKVFGNNELEATVLFHQNALTTRGQNNTVRRRNFAGNIHYGWAGKYYFDVAFSYSGNNLLPEGDQYGFFPAVSAAWLLSEEEFLRGVSFLDRLKLRASWGMSGSDYLPSNNPDVQAYGGGPGYRFTVSNVGSEGFREGRLAASDFAFETSYKTNVGIEAGFFSKLNLSADLFYARRTNILTGTDGRFSDVLGIAPPLETDGVVENKGLEAAVKWQDATGEVAYSIGGQFSFARNKIVEMNEAFRPYSYLRRTGKSIGQQFGLQAIGFFEDENDIANSPYQVFSEVQPGDVKYKDQNGDGIINEFDEVALGYASGYPEMYFSMSLGLNYKGIGISALFQGTGNYTAYLNTQSVYWPLRGNNTISSYYYNNRWTPETAGSATLPRLTTKDNDNNFRPNDLWLADRSYIKLRTLGVSYTLPASVIQSWKMDDVRIYVRGMNLFSIDDIPELDPEHVSWQYPTLRSVNMGLEIAF